MSDTEIAVETRIVNSVEEIELLWDNVQLSLYLQLQHRVGSHSCMFKWIDSDCSQKLSYPTWPLVMEYIKRTSANNAGLCFFLHLLKTLTWVAVGCAFGVNLGEPGILFSSFRWIGRNSMIRLAKLVFKPSTFSKSTHFTLLFFFSNHLL